MGSCLARQTRQTPCVSRANFNMPVLESSSYRPPLLFRNHHIHTIYPAIFRKVKDVHVSRERFETPDGDFIDLDWSRIGSENLLLTIHGLEGSSRSGYIRGMIRAFQRRGWDGVAYNLRGCSGEPNRRLRFYHSGDTNDLQTVITHILEQNHYRKLAIVGFSLGGNVTLKYLGEQDRVRPGELVKAAAISAPCDLESSVWKLAQKSNVLYMKNFLRCFRRKIRVKMQMMPGHITDQNFHEIKTFKEYDDRYTAPLHGFSDAYDYWHRASSKPLLSNIRIPTLVINALDDPFLDEPSYPYKEAEHNPYLFLQTPEKGGHIGFIARYSLEEYWHETRVTSFITEGD